MFNPVVDRQRIRHLGAVAVEFAIVIVMFLMLILGAIDLSRWLYGIDASQEAAREAARVAAVCNLGSGAPVARSLISTATLTGGTTTVTYLPASCCASQSSCATPCTGVQVSVAGYSVPRIAWFLPTMTVPTVTTYLPRESMDSTNNARCTF